MTEHATELVSLDQFETQVAELKRTYAKVPNVHTKEGYAEAKAALRTLTKMRTDTEKARLAITAPLRDRVKEINDLAKSLVGEVEKLERPIRDAKQYVDDEIKRKKEARQAKIREGIVRDITSFVDSAAGASDPAEIRAMIDTLREVDVAIYGELEVEADFERQRVIGVLSTQAMDLMGKPEDPPEPRRRNAAVNPYDEALADLAEILGDERCEEVLLAIMAGEIRHITFDS